MTNFLRDRRMQGRISQAQLAEQIGVSQQTIARWETTGQIPAKYLKDLAVCLGARVQDFLPGSPSAKVLAVPARDGLSRDDADDDFAFGDVDIWYAGDSEPRSYPVTHRMRKRIQEALGDVGCGAIETEPWVQFESLNQKWVAINTAQVERLEFVEDDVEAMTSYLHDEVYAAARELRDQLPDESQLRQDDFPYSEKMVADVVGLLEEMGENSLYELEGVTCEYVSGNVTRNLLSDEAAMSLDYVFNAADPSDLAATSYLSLYDPDLGKHQHLRLGALRYIEASLLALNEAIERTAD